MTSMANPPTHPPTDEHGERVRAHQIRPPQLLGRGRVHGAEHLGKAVEARDAVDEVEAGQQAGHE